MYMDVDMDMNMRFECVPKFRLMGAKSDKTWTTRCPKSNQKWYNMVPEWGPGRLVTHKGGHVAILDIDADRDAES